jgi:hypothetical protein
MAASVHRKQAGSMNQQAKLHKTGAYYDRNGNCHFPSRGARKREMARRGIFDQDAGYGDQSPQHATDDPEVHGRM